MSGGPVFLEKQSYRRRRLMDAIKLLPFLGLAVWMVPLLWPVPDAVTSEQNELSTSVALRYLFGGWIALVAMGWILWARMQLTESKTGQSQP